MSRPHHFPGIAGSLLALLMAGLLVACGGGETSEDDSPTTPAFVVADEASTPATPSTSLTETGSVNYVVYADGTGSAQPTVTASVTASESGAGSSTLTVSVEGTSVTVVVASGSDNATFTETIGTVEVTGRLDLQGNVALICQAAGTGTSLALVSHNMTAVESLTALRGLSFTGVDCSALGSPGLSYSFGTDGSVETADGSFSATEVAALFSANGYTDSEGGNLKWRAYQHGSGADLRFAIVALYTASGSTTSEMELMLSDVTVR